MAGLQVIPGVGEAADAIFLGMAIEYAGWSSLKAIAHLVRAMTRAIHASSEAEIAAAAPGAADALITLGGDFLDALVLRMAKRNTSGGGTAGVADTEQEAVVQTVNPDRGQGVGKRGSVKRANITPSRALNLDAKPSGIRYEGKVYRLEDPSRVETTFDVHPGNVAANHRYSGPGEGLSTELHRPKQR